jgi:hypothetical protein
MHGTTIKIRLLLFLLSPYSSELLLLLLLLLLLFSYSLILRNINKRGFRLR